MPARDSVTVLWIGKDRMRFEEDDLVAIVRADIKKLFLLETEAKVYSVIDLPYDMKKYLSAEKALITEQLAAQTKVVMSPTTETKKIKDWNATRYTLTMSMPMGGELTQASSPTTRSPGWRCVRAAAGAPGNGRELLQRSAPSEPSIPGADAQASVASMPNRRRGRARARSGAGRRAGGRRSGGARRARRPAGRWS
jgi:hypothetical protein